MWKAAAAVKDEWREGLASRGETFLEKSFAPEPHFPKAFDWWGGRAEGVRSDMRGTFMGGPSNRLHLWDAADRDAISVKAFEGECQPCWHFWRKEKYGVPPFPQDFSPSAKGAHACG